MTSNIRTLAELTRVQAERFGDRVAFVCESREITYAEFDARTDGVAAALLGGGLAPGGRVGLLDKDSERAFEVILGCAKAGAVSLGVNWRLAPPEIAYILNDAGAEVLFVGGEFVPKIEAVLGELRGVKKIVLLSGARAGWEPYEAWVGVRAVAAPQVEVRPEDLAVLMYTSGTTGRPKGVMLPHYSFFAVADELECSGARWLDWNSDDVNMLNIPAFHIGGMWWAVRGLAAGAKNVVLDAFVAWKFIELVSRHKATKACLVPAMLQLILSEQGRGPDSLASMRHVAYGGSPIASPLLLAAMEAFGCPFTQLYGMTETGNMAVNLPPADHDPRGNTRMRAAGKALPGVSVSVTDGEGNPLSPRAVGEVRIKSPANMLGYWNLEEETARTLVDGWVRTGDAGYLDEDGYVYICDRLKDMIIYAGENVYPAEIEGVVGAHPAVAEVAVIGVPDPRWGETIKALVVLKPGARATAAELIAHARRQIADFKVPKSVEFVEMLPRTPSGKLRKAELREPYWRGYERRVN